MMSQQQNPPTVSQSQLQQMDTEKTNAEADVKPFSIRQYVLASRHKSILQNWPFPEKYLQMCLNRGLRDVLPPFERQTSIAEPLNGCSNLMHLRVDSEAADFCKPEVPHLIEHTQNIRNDYHLLSNGERYKITNHNRDSPSSHEDRNQHNSSVSVNLSQSADTCTLPSSTHVHKSGPALASSKVMKNKRRRRKGRCKKRSMVDILAVARHCTLEEIYRMNRFCYAETATEGCQQMMPSENIYKSELTGDHSFRKAGSEDHEVANVDMTGKGTLHLKFKLNGCNV